MPRPNESDLLYKKAGAGSAGSLQASAAKTEKSDFAWVNDEPFPAVSAGFLQRADLYVEGELAALQGRALAYLRASIPVHFRGPPGVGKTTLALDLAERLGRPHVLVTGDSSMTSADLLGREIGATSRHLRDSYIQSVRRTESETRATWADSVLTRAMETGQTLVYDEFTRAPASANNALLSALEERVLVFSNPTRESRHVIAHPEFRVIFTSNPEEYAGTNRAPDALYDRMITFDLAAPSADAETGIVACRTGLAVEDAANIVGLVRRLRDDITSTPPLSLRSAIMIAMLVAAERVPTDPRDSRYVQICIDVLESRIGPALGDSSPDSRRSSLHKAILVCSPMNSPRSRTES